MPAGRHGLLPRGELARHRPLRLRPVGQRELAAQLIWLVNQLGQRVGVLQADQLHHDADALVLGQLPHRVHHLEERAGCVGGHSLLDLLRGKADLCHRGMELLGALLGSRELLGDGVDGGASGLGAVAQRQQGRGEGCSVSRRHRNRGDYAGDAIQNVDDVAALADGIVIEVIDGIRQPHDRVGRDPEVLCHLAHALGDFVRHGIKGRGHHRHGPGVRDQLVARHLHAGARSDHLRDRGGGDRQLFTEALDLARHVVIDLRQLAAIVPGAFDLAGDAQHRVLEADIVLHRLGDWGEGHATSCHGRHAGIEHGIPGAHALLVLRMGGGHLALALANRPKPRFLLRQRL
ncbi:hypothetical protein D3C81_1103690 [compost metagenome]